MTEASPRLSVLATRRGTPVLRDNLDTEHIAASYDTGVLTLRIPVAEQAKPHKIATSTNTENRQAIDA
ncbi:MAG: Hsp20 family protein [Mycobacteriales bacterium]